MVKPRSSAGVFYRMGAPATFMVGLHGAKEIRENPCFFFSENVNQSQLSSLFQYVNHKLGEGQQNPVFIGDCWIF
ncbi:hypothetical protein ALP54_03514 [Pseudomonas amygdali pv. lachrymans]|nr:hypothetical protein ALP54_03514 [Pseudomonas amygdali pv. lachrymans]